MSQASLSKKQAKALLKRFTNYLSVQMVLDMPRHVENFLRDELDGDGEVECYHPAEVITTLNQQVVNPALGDHDTEPNMLICKVEPQSSLISKHNWDTVGNTIAEARKNYRPVKDRIDAQFSVKKEEEGANDGGDDHNEKRSARGSLHSRLQMSKCAIRYCSDCDKYGHKTAYCWNRKRSRHD